MYRSHMLSAVALLLCVCACDSRKDFTGRYEVSGTLLVGDGAQRNEYEVKGEQFVIIADAFDSDRLYVDFDCGLSATMRDSDSFQFDSKTCASYTQDECTFAWTFKSGQGSLKETEPVLDVRPSGVIQGRCSDGSSGTVSFWFTMTGVRKSEPSSGSAPGVQSRGTSALRATLQQVLRSHLR